jgi:hypothetical protein
MKGYIIAPWLEEERDNYCLYSSPLLASLLNPIGENIQEPYTMFEVEAEDMTVEETPNHPIIHGTSISKIREIEFTVLDLISKIRYAITYTKRIYDDAEWNHWADNWLDNIDRSAERAYKASYQAGRVEAFKKLSTERMAARIADTVSWAAYISLQTDREADVDRAIAQSICDMYYLNPDSLLEV